MNARWLRLLGAGALALTSLLAHAQYSWLDDKGARVYSDRPPPPGTPAARILKTPPGLAAAPSAEQPKQAPAQDAAARTAVPDWVRQEQEYKKRAALRETMEKEAAHARTLRQMDCIPARHTRSQLDSGRRLARLTKDGGREFLSDEERVRLREQSDRALANCD